MNGWRRHYGVPGIYGSNFRRVAVTEDARRGLLGQGSILTVTSHADRTSPVVRGKWVLENLLGAPPPPPPPEVPPLPENTEDAPPKTLRARLELHRANAVCASCHKVMDPIGFALENFDATGAWRTEEFGAPIDATGQLADGTNVNGVVSLRNAILARPEVFAGTVTEKLMIYALGRGLDPYDMPAVRAIVRDAASHNYPSFVDHNGSDSKRAVPDAKEAGVETMFITKKSLARRTFLRGLSATVALPFLDAMAPALTAATAAPKRLGFVYFPNGAIMDSWIPKTAGAGFEFTPTLAPLAPYQDHLAVIGNLARAGTTIGDHAVAAAGWLTGVYAKKTEAEDVLAGPTIDQIIATPDRAGHGLPVTGTGHGRFHRLYRRLHSGVQLHLHEHSLLGGADQSSAHGDQPARGV